MVLFIMKKIPFNISINVLINNEALNKLQDYNGN